MHLYMQPTLILGLGGVALEVLLRVLQPVLVVHAVLVLLAVVLVLTAQEGRHGRGR